MWKSIVIAIILAIGTASGANADTYANLWKQYAQAQDKDLPQSCRAILTKIIAKAEAEQAYGHLIKAQTTKISLARALSEDSLLAELDQLTAVANATADNVRAAVYAAALGRTYAELAHGDSTFRARSRKWYARSMAHPEQLASAPAKGFEPLVVNGIDSRAFGDDLLHVIGMQSGRYQELYDYYQAHGNRRAACLAACLLVRSQSSYSLETRMRKSKRLQRIDSLLLEYQDLAEAAELAIEHYQLIDVATDAKTEDKINYINYALSRWGEWPRMNLLRNAKTDLTNPMFNISLKENVLRPGEDRTVMVNSIRNINELTMNVYRLNASYNDIQRLEGKKLQEVRRHASKTPLQSQTLKFYGQPTYKISSDTMVIKGLDRGCYLVEIVADNRNVKAQYEILHVTNLFTLWQSMPNDRVRIAVVDATTGEPCPNAKVTLLDNNKKPAVSLTTDSKGETQYLGKKQYSYIGAATAGDTYAPYLNFYSWFRFREAANNEEETVQLYTDRSIYRPGQTVHAAIIAYSRQQKVQTTALEGKTYTLTLRDANYKVVADKTVTTDAYGTAAADFTLPASGLNGRYTLRVDGNASVGFYVEEYKRPTFLVDFDKVNTKYENGDTVTVVGHAKSYAGIPVQGGEVRYTVMRRQAIWWWYRGNNEDAGPIAFGVIKTDENGDFRIKVPVVLPEAADEAHPRFFQFNIDATVTSLSGESHSANTSLPLGTRPTALSCTLPQQAVADSLRTFRFTYKNSAGNDIDGDVAYTLDGRDYTAKANQDIDAMALWGKLKSGRHSLKAICGNDTITQTFVTFTPTDTKAPIETHDWFYLSAKKFESDGQKIHLQLGSTDDRLHVVYLLLAGNKIVEQGTLDLQGQLYQRDFQYKPEYGDGLSISYAWVKNGELYEHNETLQRPLPDTRLIAKWSTFRDRLTPGQQEEWTLHVARPDGKAAAAQLMATFYDKSLDAIASNDWSFSNRYNPRNPSAHWQGGNYGISALYGFMPTTNLKVPSLDFSHFDRDAFPFGHEVMVLKQCETVATDEIRVRGLSSRANKAKEASPMVAMALSSTAENAIYGARDVASESESGKNASEQLRENLNETAFFYPNLETNAKGDIKIKFTLPESVTTWRFLGIVHDKQMNNGLVDNEVIAQKPIMVQPNVPRFLRSGDKATISATISNTSATTVSGNARIELIDAETLKTVHSESKPVTIAANGSVGVAFDYTPTDNDQILICKVSAQGNKFSDGEQHYLPILPDKELVTNTVPFTQNAKGTKTIDISRLFPKGSSQQRLTVEYTDNPAWLMVQALPAMGNPNADNAISLSADYYATGIAHNILSQSPAIQQTLKLWQQEQGVATTLTSRLAKDQDLKTMVLDETPWVMDAKNESERMSQLSSYFDDNQLLQRRQTSLEKLQKLQRADGSFSWCPGMEGSVYMTVAVVETLVRLNKLIGVQADTKTILAKAFGYLDKRIAEQVAELKKAEKKGTKAIGPSETACHYLYAAALAGKATTADTDYLIGLLTKAPARYSIYGKANIAVILALNGKTSKASDYLKSVQEYSVYSEEMGRYFDSPKANYSWMDYRIPTQVAAIEATQLIAPSDATSVEQMRRWLLQEKRTTAWNTPINSVNAVYAFLNGNMQQLAPSASAPALLKVDGKKVDTGKASAGLGYRKGTVSNGQMRTFTAEKTTNNTSWGALYAQFMQPTTEVDNASSGLSVKREIVNGGKQLKVGDRVTVRITIKADRDYDFVQVVDHRAACLEPVGQLSGYWGGYYCSPKDQKTTYYYNKVAKGKHTIETEYFIDRAGDYNTGTCTVQCAYSPEYMGREGGKNITVNP